MDFFIRKKPCLIIEEQKTSEETKKLLSNKLLFLQKQYKFSFDALHKSENISPEFLQNALFTWDLNSKVLSAIKYLVDTSEAEWTFLNNFTSESSTECFFGTTNVKSRILRTDIIFEDVDYFFLKLLKFGVIEMQDWINLTRLNLHKIALGTDCINDSSYYSCKQKNVLIPFSIVKTILASLEQAKNDCYKFLGRPLKFKNYEPVLWRFLKITKFSKNSKIVSDLFQKTRCKYENLRKQRGQYGIESEQFSSLLEGIEKISNFTKVHIALSEFSAFESEIKKLFGYVFVTFLNNDNHFVFDENNEKYLKRSVDEKLIAATKWLDLFLFLSENEINISKYLSDIVLKNLKTSCQIELSILNDPDDMRNMYATNSSNVFLIIKIIQKLKNNKFAVSKYLKFLTPYLTNFLPV